MEILDFVYSKAITVLVFFVLLQATCNDKQPVMSYYMLFCKHSREVIAIPLSQEALGEISFVRPFFV